MSEFAISICIANWNGREMLRRLLESIERTAEGMTVQTIVVDNASNDGSAAMVREEFPHVLLIVNDRNEGFARANNQAAAAAVHPLLLFLNNDTIVRSQALRKLAEFLKEHPDYSAVGPRLIGRNGKPQRSARGLPTFAGLLHRILLLRWTGLFKRAYTRCRSGGHHPQRSGPVEQLDAAALLVRREQFRACGGWDEGFRFGVEDVDLCARLHRFGPIYYLAEAEIEHLGRISSQRNRSFVYRGYECGYARYIRKHHPRRAAAWLYKLLVTIDMPVRLAVLLFRWSRDEMIRAQARQRSRQRLRAAASFALLGLPALWRA